MPSENQSDDQVASQDEYQISFAEGIDDEALLDSTDANKFLITSYGADYAVDALVKRMKAGAFKIPDFQRRFIWTQSHASKFIESLLMGLPVPGIFLYKEAQTNKHLVIDGQQRLRTLESFYNGLFHEKKFRLIGVRYPWLNKTYDDLSPEDQLKLDDSIVHATIFKQDKPADVLDSIYFVFERINSGGIRLSPQEIRNCIASGPFTEMVKDLNDNLDWRSVFGAPVNKRAKDQELILRFFAMYLDGEKYQRPMAKFLNDFAAKENLSPPANLRVMADIFAKTITLVLQALNGRAFRPTRIFNAAVFDSVMTGLAIRLGHGGAISSESVRANYDALILDQDFLRACERATADEENVKTRRSAAIKAFEEV